MKIIFKKEPTPDQTFRTLDIENLYYLSKEFPNLQTKVTALYKASIIFIDPTTGANPTTQETHFEQLMDSIYYPTARLTTIFDSLTNIQIQFKTGSS